MSPIDKLPPISKMYVVLIIKKIVEIFLFSYSEPLFRRTATGESDGSGPSPPSSADSDGIPALPTVSDESIDRVMGHIVSRPGAAMKLPPLPPSPPLRLPKNTR